MSYIMKTMHIPEQLSGRGLPPAGDWEVVANKSTVAFSGRAARIAPTVRAAFTGVQGALHLAADPNGSRVSVDVDVRTVTTGNQVWDEMLRVADPFRASEHPVARYLSSQVRWTGSAFTVDGTLHIAGATAPLRLAATISETAGEAVALRAQGSMDPRAAGVSLDLPGARLLMPRALQLSIAVVATRARVGDRRFALAS